jgi:hypothetical protein
VKNTDQPSLPITNSTDVKSQAIGVLRDELDRVGAVSLVDAHRARGADAIAVQEQHDLADYLLLGPAGNDALRPLPADPGHLPQAARLLFDDIENGIAERTYQLPGVDRPDAADYARAKILLDPLGRRRCCGLEERGSELDAVGAVVDPVPAGLDELAGRDHRRVAENRDQVALAAGFDAQHAEAVLFVVEGDALDEAHEDLGWRARPRCLRHHSMMKMKILRRYRIEPARVSGAACDRTKGLERAGRRSPRQNHRRLRCCSRRRELHLRNSGFRVSCVNVDI